jgi:hypothetical protein
VEASYRPSPDSPGRDSTTFAAMAHPRKSRFGIQLHTATTGAEWAEPARKAEDLGYSYNVVQQDAMATLAPVVARLAGT